MICVSGFPGRCGTKPWMQGFTILELMIVVFIVGVALAFTTPSLWGFLRSSSLRNAAYQITSDLHLAKSTAVRSGADCSVIFNSPAADRYSVTILNRTQDLDTYIGGVVFAANPDGSADAFSPSITFDTRGLCAAAAQVYVTNRDNSSIYRIQVSAAGGISMQRWNSAARRWN